MTAANSKAAPSAATAQRPTSKDGVGIVQKAAGAWNADPDTFAIREGFNIRYDFGNIRELAEQIRAKLRRDPKSGGLIHPIGVKRLRDDDPLVKTGGLRAFDLSACGVDLKYRPKGPHAFETIRGNRRTLAIWLLLQEGETFPHGVPVTILDKAMDRRTATIENFVENTSKPLLPIEQAYGFKTLRDGDPEHGVPPMTIKEITDVTGFSDQTINGALALLEADEEVIGALKGGHVAATTAKQIAVHARGDKGRQRELVKTALAATDKKGRDALKKELEAAQRDKHARKGRVLKVRVLSEDDLADLGVKQQQIVMDRLKDARKAPDFDILAWIRSDDKLALACAFGALQALKAAAGVKVDLNV